MSKQVVILHGWSDDSSSFTGLAAFLKRSGFQTVPIFLGDYISLRNDVTIDDVAKRMQDVVAERLALAPDSPGRLGPTFHLVVHSTGGLVARRWLSRYYAGRPCPVKNLLMLAPANFGSKLAHMGRSLLGRLVKGWSTGLETGDEMLYALELGSPFLWDLAQADLFARQTEAPAIYGPDKVRPYVIVGTHPYDKLVNQLTNEYGSDGTVRVAAANLNARGVTIDFTGGPERVLSPELTPWPRRGSDDLQFPLAVLPDRDHGSITRPDDPGYSRQEAAQRRLGDLILEALQVRTSAQYGRVLAGWDAVTAETRTFAGTAEAAVRHRNGFFRQRGVEPQYFHEHYQVHVQARDEFGEPVPDYFLVFMPQWQKKKFFGLKTDLPRESVFFQKEVLTHVHRHRREPSNLCLFLDRFDLMRKGGFYDQVPGSKQVDLAFTVTAENPGDRIAYFSQLKNAQHGLIRLHDHQSPANRWLQRHTTHFIELVIPRAAVDEVFKLRRG